MRLRHRILEQLAKTESGRRLIGEPRSRMVLTAALGLLLNLLYAIYHGALGITHLSLWFMTMSAYYTVLSVMRFSVVLCEYKSGPGPSEDTEYFVMKLSGALLAGLSLILAGTVCISLSRNIAAKHGEITMITIAAYTFCKIVMAAARAVRQRKDPSPLLAVIRNIGYAEVAASVVTLQRSMLVSFGGMDGARAHTMNSWTGAAVCLFIFILGILMLIRGAGKGKPHGKIQACARK